MALSSAGLVDEAVAIGDAIAELDKESSAMYANDVAVICAQAGRVEQALERVEANLGRFPDASTSAAAAAELRRVRRRGAARAFAAAERDRR